MKNRKAKQENRITYTYWRWDEESKKNLPITIIAGQDSVTEEHIIMLNELDHAADLGDRYEQENRDYETENQKLKNEREPENSIGDPIENLSTLKTDPAFFLEQKSDEPNPLVEQLLTLMEKLTPQQIDLIYDLFGSQRQLTEIANEEGKSVTAIHNRKSKIIARLRKLFAEQGIL
jgi:DNA-directed RNA polymerase specialized sigma24 family protein